MIPPDTIIPNNNRGRDFFNGTPKTKAAKDPVMPPAKGMGVAARIKIAHSPYFFIFLSVLFLVCLNSHLKNLRKKKIYFDRNFATGSKIKTINTIAK